jgi:PTS system ascorbate-specific IIA component
MLLKDLVDNKLTCYEQSFDDWKEAIKANGVPLKNEGYIDDQYIGAVIACVEKYGPYIVIAPNIAMPHSTEGAPGVYKTGIGFMKVEEPVHFDPADPEKDARLFFMLASNDSDAHLNNMMQLADMLSNDDLVADLLEAKNDEDLLKVAEKYGEE